MAENRTKRPASGKVRGTKAPTNERGTTPSHDAEVINRQGARVNTLKTVLEVIGAIVTIGAALIGAVYGIGKIVGIPWLVLTPDSTLLVTVGPVLSNQNEVQVDLTGTVVIDNRGLGNTLIVDIVFDAEFVAGASLQASASNIRCVSSQKEALALPISVAAGDKPLRLECTASRILAEDRIAQLASGIQTVRLGFIANGGKVHSVRYCVSRDVSFWQRLVKDSRPTSRYFVDALCEG